MKLAWKLHHHWDFLKLNCHWPEHNLWGLSSALQKHADVTARFSTYDLLPVMKNTYGLAQSAVTVMLSPVVCCALSIVRSNSFRNTYIICAVCKLPVFNMVVMSHIPSRAFIIHDALVSLKTMQYKGNSIHLKTYTVNIVLGVYLLILLLTRQ